MAASAAQGGFVAVDVHRILFAHDGGGGLEGGADDYAFAVGYAALHAAGVVRSGADASGVVVERVVVLGAGHARSGEAGADFEALAGGQRQHRARQIRLQLVEHRLAPAGRDAARGALHYPAERIAALPRGLDALYHPRGDVRVGAARDVLFHLVGGHQLRVDARLDVPHALDVGDDFDAVFGGEPLAGNRAAGDAPNRLARARASAAHPVADAVLGVV